MTLDEKLDWIADALMHIIKSETPYSEELLDKWYKIFINPKMQFKPEEQNKRKGLFLD